MVKNKLLIVYLILISNNTFSAIKSLKNYSSDQTVFVDLIWKDKNCDTSLFELSPNKELTSVGKRGCNLGSIYVYDLQGKKDYDKWQEAAKNKQEDAWKLKPKEKINLDKSVKSCDYLNIYSVNTETGPEFIATCANDKKYNLNNFTSAQDAESKQDYKNFEIKSERPGNLRLWYEQNKK